MLPSTDWDWADEIDATALRRMAQVTLELFHQPQRWIHRRVERIYFNDHQSVHHQVSVDFTLPGSIMPISQFEGKDVYIAPLFLLPKDSAEPLREGKRSWYQYFLVGKRQLGEMNPIPTPACSNMDFVNQDGNRLPLVTHEQSGLLGAMMLREAAERILGRPLEGNLQEQIEAVPQRSVLDLSDTLDWLLITKTATPHDLRNKLRERSDFTELTYILASHSLVACLFLDGVPRRSIYKLSYDHPTDDNPSPDQGIIRRNVAALWRSLGWKSEQYFVPLSEIGASSSYHVEVEIPNELLINEINLVGKRYRRFTELYSRANRDYAIKQVGSASRGEIYIPKLTVDRRVGIIWVKLRPHRAGFLFGALVASIVTSVMLWMAASAAPEVVRDGKAEAGAAALLLVPALLAAYIARPGEHAITTKMLHWARLVLVADAILPALAVYFLVRTQEEGSPSYILKFGSFSVLVGGTNNAAHVAHSLEQSWTILAKVSVFPVLAFLISNITPIPHGKTVYQRPDN